MNNKYVLYICNCCSEFIFTIDNLTDLRLKHSFTAADLYKDSIILQKMNDFFTVICWLAVTSSMPVTGDGSSNPCYLQIESIRRFV